MFARSAMITLALMIGATAFAQDDGDIRDLRVGMTLDEMPAQGYVNFACGSDGGPPLRPLGGWQDFSLCPAEAHGLHEVYVEYDDDRQAIADLYRQMYGEALWIEKYAGTRIAGYPVVLSLLFDADGVVRGLRAVTDARAPLDLRVRAHAMRMRVKPRYAGWDCVDLPLAEGETPIGSRYVKELCRTVDDAGRQIVLRADQYRKPGQTGFDENGQYVEGDFESTARWEIWDASVALD